MDTYTIIVNLFVLFGVVVLSYLVVKTMIEKEKLQKELEQIKKECSFWKDTLKRLTK